LLAHPDLPTCEVCRRWMVDTQQWRLNRNRHGEPTRRPSYSPTPCNQCPRRDGNDKIVLSRKNRQTMDCYFEHKATGGTVADPIARRNFGLLERLFDRHRREQRQAILTATLLLGGK